MEGVEGVIFHLRSAVVALELVLRLHRQDGGSLALGVGVVTLGLDLSLGGRRLWLIEGGAMLEETPLFSLGTRVSNVDELDGRGEVVPDAELLQHAVVGDTVVEGGDDIRVGHAGDLVARLAETLEVLAERLVGAFSHRAEVVEGEVVLVGAFEVGDELQAQFLVGVDASPGRFMSQVMAASLRAMGSQLAMHLLSPFATQTVRL